MEYFIKIVFGTLKRWRGIATRYAKLTVSFIVAIHIRCFPLHPPSSPHYLEQCLSLG
ncbi:hypothetical protein [Treponema endosymbiont of Eucomonympha sp.]|uniref:hypothetical protein n=1 Tax=Treponema endosymbiont of Eucomonympha sp. TaxID=1580831 RepID=UPI000AB88129|nr:hypothetical protein [Treponema endosymbiont of Eucomonympha sp.]